MNRILSELDRFKQWPDSQRVDAIRTLLPPQLLRIILADDRLPHAFLLWFVVGFGLFVRDS